MIGFRVLKNNKDFKEKAINHRFKERKKTLPVLI